jgi:hypothetical protein
VAFFRHVVWLPVWGACSSPPPPPPRGNPGVPKLPVAA